MLQQRVTQDLVGNRLHGSCQRRKFSVDLFQLGRSRPYIYNGASMRAWAGCENTPCCPETKQGRKSKFTTEFLWCSVLEYNSSPRKCSDPRGTIIVPSLARRPPSATFT